MLLFHKLSQSSAHQPGSCGDQILQGHLLAVLDPLAIENGGDRREVGKYEIVLINIPAECASVTFRLVGHDPGVDPVPNVFVAAA